VAAGFGAGASWIIHAISGVSGAGRAAKEENLFISVDANVRAYRVGNHQHTPEIEQELRCADGAGPGSILFVPHVGPYHSGIMATIYIPVEPGTYPPTNGDLEAILREAYGNEPYVRVRPATALPQIALVTGTNFCDIGATFDPRTSTIVVVSCIDNLIKGAAGQAVQNMNIMFGLEETAGLA
jgi:N-acetyl-gamma-glutamyl-phosphate reductase